jgi:hypothetical protein
MNPPSPSSLFSREQGSKGAREQGKEGTVGWFHRYDVPARRRASRSSQLLVRARSANLYEIQLGSRHTSTFIQDAGEAYDAASALLHSWSEHVRAKREPRGLSIRQLLVLGLKLEREDHVAAAIYLLFFSCHSLDNQSVGQGLPRHAGSSGLVCVCVCVSCWDAAVDPLAVSLQPLCFRPVDWFPFSQCACLLSSAGSS